MKPINSDKLNVARVRDKILAKRPQLRERGKQEFDEHGIPIMGYGEHVALAEAAVKVTREEARIVRSPEVQEMVANAQATTQKPRIDVRVALLELGKGEVERLMDKYQKKYQAEGDDLDTSIMRATERVEKRAVTLSSKRAKQLAKQVRKQQAADKAKTAQIAEQAMPDRRMPPAPVAGPPPDFNQAWRDLVVDLMGEGLSESEAKDCAIKEVLQQADAYYQQVTDAYRARQVAQHPGPLPPQTGARAPTPRPQLSANYRHGGNNPKEQLSPRRMVAQLPPGVTPLRAAVDGIQPIVKCVDEEQQFLAEKIAKHKLNGLTLEEAVCRAYHATQDRKAGAK
jgi:hypothetical protein